MNFVISMSFMNMQATIVYLIIMTYYIGIKEEDVKL